MPQLSPATNRAQVERRFDRVVKIHADAEDVGEHSVAARELEDSHTERRRERVSDDGHTGEAAEAARGGAAGTGAPIATIRSNPTAIHAKSRTRPTIDVYRPSWGSRPNRLNSP